MSMHMSVVAIAGHLSNPMVPHTGMSPTHYDVSVDVVYAVLQLSRIVAGIGVILAVVIASFGRAFLCHRNAESSARRQEESSTR